MALIDRNTSDMKKFHSYITLCLLALLVSGELHAQHQFSATEQAVISVPTPGLFTHSNAFEINFTILKDNEYSFPLPVGKAEVIGGQALEITTTKGDAVKAMFAGTVRMARRSEQYGNVVIIRHDNGLETVYARNAQNLVKPGQRVKAGQTVAIVGNDGQKATCYFAFLINGGWINPETILEVKGHKLRRQVVQCRKSGNHVVLTVTKEEKQAKLTLDPDDVGEDPLLKNATFKLDLGKIEQEHWSYPLPGAHIISQYGQRGKKTHSGVDIKTKANDEVLAAFDGVVVQSGPYFAYGNYIVIRHAYGFSTCYSHQSKNTVRAGQKVKAGQVIGYTGQTGRATTPHLHFELRFKSRTINPGVFFDHANYKLKANVLTLGRNGSVR